MSSILDLFLGLDSPQLPYDYLQIVGREIPFAVPNIANDQRRYSEEGEPTKVRWYPYNDLYLNLSLHDTGGKRP